MIIKPESETQVHNGTCYNTEDIHALLQGAIGYLTAFYQKAPDSMKGWGWLAMSIPKDVVVRYGWSAPLIYWKLGEHNRSTLIIEMPFKSNLLVDPLEALGCLEMVPASVMSVLGERMCCLTRLQSSTIREFPLAAFFDREVDKEDAWSTFLAGLREAAIVNGIRVMDKVDPNDKREAMQYNHTARLSELQLKEREKEAQIRWLTNRIERKKKQIEALQKKQQKEITFLGRLK